MYSESITLSSLICDEDDKLTLWGLARLFQDVAGNHSDSLGVGFEDLKPLNKAWILTHVYYNILRLPSAGERLTLRTWPKPDNGLIAPRDYQLIDEQGNICASSASNWVILDMNSRRVSRLHDIIDRFEKETHNATKYAKLEKIKMPPDLQDLKHFDVPYSSIDHTRHVNNAEYIKWICDSIPEICGSRTEIRTSENPNIRTSEHLNILTSSNCTPTLTPHLTPNCTPTLTPNPYRREIREFEINYLKETKYGDQNVLILQHRESSDSNIQPSDTPDSINPHIKSLDSLFFQILNSNGISVNAHIILN